MAWAPEPAPRPERKRERKRTTQHHYGATHQHLRRLRLAKYPICERCHEAFAEEAHHLVYPAKSVDDYQAVCKPCHRTITREAKRGGR